MIILAFCIPEPPFQMISKLLPLIVILILPPPPILIPPVSDIVALDPYPMLWPCIPHYFLTTSLYPVILWFFPWNYQFNYFFVVVSIFCHFVCLIFFACPLSISYTPPPPSLSLSSSIASCQRGYCAYPMWLQIFLRFTSWKVHFIHPHPRHLHCLPFLMKNVP